MTALIDRSLVLGIHPTARGFGWAALDGPFAVFDHGLFTTEGPEKNERCLAEFIRLIDEFTPDCLVLESFDTKSSQRSGRIRELCLSLVSLAADRDLTLAVYSRADVLEAFAGTRARTRDEIAQAVARTLPALAPRLPEKRGAGDSEDKRLAIFAATALVLTWYHFGTLGLFDDLSRAA